MIIAQLLVSQSVSQLVRLKVESMRLIEVNQPKNIFKFNLINCLYIFLYIPIFGSVEQFDPKYTQNPISKGGGVESAHPSPILLFIKNMLVLIGLSMLSGF